jgi:murein DD-endopeptidase MepM/ murein hydrolase activator NlpD
MPKTNKTKSRVSKRISSKRGFQFRWWMGVLLVVVVAAIGVLVPRFSNASGNVSVVLRPSDTNVKVCNTSPESQALHLCAGEFADSTDGKAWRTSVNTLGRFKWFRPYEKLTAWPDDSAKSVLACVTVRDNAALLKQFNPLYNTVTKYVFDITIDDGTRVLSSRTIEGQVGAFKTGSNGLTIQCLSADLPANTYPADYSHVEYRIRVLQGSVDIFQMARTLRGTVTSSLVPATTTAKPEAMIWPVNASIAKMRGPNSPGGSGCYGAPRASGSRHQGVDLIGTGNIRAVNGNLYNDQIDVMAAKAGTVVNINTPPNPGGYGNFLIIEHAPGQLYTLYGHLSSISVGVGQHVDQGQEIGHTDETGNAGPIQAGFVHTGNQVHFQVQNKYSGSAGIPFSNTINPSDLITQPIDRNGC